MDENLGYGRMETVALYETICVTDIRRGGANRVAVYYILYQTHILYIYIYIYINFTLEQATKAQRGSRGITLPFLSPRR